LASCLQLAKRSFEALPPGGRLFLHEMVLNDTKDGPLVAVAFSMGMLALTGKQYSVDELDQLLQEAGFTGTTVTPTYAYYSLVSATKPT
jgi:O-methyltransferase domain